MNIFGNLGLKITLLSLLLAAIPVWSHGVDMREPDKDTVPDFAILENETQTSDNIDDFSDDSRNESDIASEDAEETREDDEEKQSDSKEDEDANISSESDENQDNHDEKNTGENLPDDENSDNSAGDGEDKDVSPSDTGDNNDEENPSSDGERENTDNPSGGKSDDENKDDEDSNKDTPTPPTAQIHATDIDVGDVSPVILGTSQVLSVTLIPVNSTDTLTYTSLTPSIASVNQLGRVRGLAIGTAKIQISAGEITQVISVSVVREETEDDEAPEFVAATAVDVEYQETMTIGTTQVLVPSLLPSNANSTVRYSSDNTSVASVNDFGRVTALSPGVAGITVSADRVRKTVQITVKDEITVEAMDFGDVPTEMTVGNSQTLSVNILPTEAASQTVTYHSSDPDILEINSFGRVVAKNVGTATITARAGESRCAVTITVKPEIQVEKMDFGDVPTEMTVGSSQALNVSVLPVEAASQTVTYYSSDPDILEVNSFGRLIARQTGTAVVTAESGDASCSLTITVKEEIKAADIDFSDVQTEMVLGTSQMLNVIILPTEVSNRTITYGSSDNSVVEVNPFGRLTALELGTAEITASVDQISKTITITVRAKIEPNDIDFETPDLELLLGSSVNLGASVLPTNAEEQTIRYSSSNPAILTVNAAGKITGRRLGTGTVFLEAGNVRKSVTISVVEEVSVNNIEVSEFNKKMKVDSTQTLSTSVFPTDAKNQTITFSSSDTNVAAVSEGGVITAKSSGETTIILKAGKAEKRLNLTVYIATDEIQIPENYLILHPSDQYQIYATVKPDGADQNVTYRSTDTSVASVTTDGLITASSVGRSSIILENDDSMATITVIVNKRSVSGGETSEDVPQNEGEDHEDNLAKIIREAGGADTVTESGSYYPFITNDVLLALYQTQKTLRVTYEKYSVLIHGNNVRNVNNEFPTDITMRETKKGITFTVSEGYNLPGNIGIDFANIPSDYRYLYLFNEVTAKYERLNMDDGQKAEIGTPGAYLLTKKKLRSISWPIYSSIAVGSLLIVGAGVYILTKKKYWFW